MSHHHDHSSESSSPTMTFPQKARKLIDHWIQHNEDHAQSYREWADNFRQSGLDSAADRLETAADLTRQINLTLTGALDQIQE